MPQPPERVLSDASLPVRLRELPEPPDKLYVHGELPRGAAVAIVGTRHPSPEAARYAYELSFELALAGVSVMSGGAEGIDSVAHLGALDAHGSTVVVAPAGFAKPFPAFNAPIFRRVVREGGAYLSLEQSEVGAGRGRYFDRNRVLAALAHVVVVIEAPIVSGARNTAKWARRLGRPLFVCGAPPWRPSGHGCILELRLGARPLHSYRDVLRALADQRAHAFRAGGQLPLLAESAESSASFGDGSETERVVRAVGRGARTVDAVCDRTGLSAARVQQLVLTLTLEGVLVPDSAGRLSVANAGIL